LFSARIQPGFDGISYGLVEKLIKELKRPEEEEM